MKKTLGYIGLGKMGKNMTLSLLEKGWKVTAYDRAPEAVSEVESKGGDGVGTIAEMVQKLESPRLIWVMVPHQVVDEVCEELALTLSPGDTVIDGGNSNYKETMRRNTMFKDKEIHFLDAGTSGGPAGARDGACIMIGGEKEIFQNYEELFKDIVSTPIFRQLNDVRAIHADRVPVGAG